MTPQWYCSWLLIGLATQTSAVLAADCGKVTIADMNWASAEFAAYVDKAILETAFGCDVELIPGDTVPTMTSMSEKAQPDLAPELWLNAGREKIDAAIAEKKLVNIGPTLTDGGEQGWWIPRYMQEANPELTTLSAVLKHPELFPHPDNKSRGGFMTCPSGWACQAVSNNLYKAFGLEKAGFDLVDPGSAAGLDGSIAKAYERKQPWLGYYWAPTAILGKYPMVRLDLESPFDAAAFESCTAKEDCIDPKPNNFPVAEVRTIATSELAQRAPQVVEYLAKRSYKNELLNGVLAWMESEKASGAEGARYFLQHHEDLWSKWVPVEMVAKVKASVAP